MNGVFTTKLEGKHLGVSKFSLNLHCFSLDMNAIPSLSRSKFSLNTDRKLAKRKNVFSHIFVNSFITQLILNGKTTHKDIIWLVDGLPV